MELYQDTCNMLMDLCLSMLHTLSMHFSYIYSGSATCTSINYYPNPIQSRSRLKFYDAIIHYSYAGTWHRYRIDLHRGHWPVYVRILAISDIDMDTDLTIRSTWYAKINEEGAVKDLLKLALRTPKPTEVPKKRFLGKHKSCNKTRRNQIHANAANRERMARK